MSVAAVWVLCALAFLPSVSGAGTSIKASRLLVQPAGVELRGAAAEHGLLVTAVASDGRTVDVTAQAKFTSKDPKVIVVGTNGACRALADGQTEILVAFGGRTERVTVSAVEVAAERAPSFRQDIEPVLTRTGCNSGGCHGKLAGQNGFRLSLRGYAPELDYDWLTTEVHARRIDPAVPSESLLVLKPLGSVPHEGHQRFTEASRYYRTLLDWIAARAPGPDPQESDAVRLELLPGNRTLRAGETQQLLARAHYPDGRVRDVTWLAQFFSNDETTIAVTSDGLAKALRPGETAVRAHFQGQVEVVRFTIPYENKVDAKEFVRANNPIDGAVFGKLKALRIPPSPDCDDATFLRRASLDATGTLPSSEEARAFLADKRAGKRARVVDQLLERPEFVDYWTLQLSDLLQNRKERDHDVRGTKGVRAFHAWLRTQVAANRPWNELAREVLTASGDSVSQPQIGYFITTVGEKKADESEVADSVAQAFLGTRIGCAKCHNHPLEKFTQDDYFHFAAFFARTSLDRQNPDNSKTTLFSSGKEERQQSERIEQLDKSLAEADAAVTAAKDADERKPAEKKFAEMTKQVEDARKELRKLQAKPIGVTQPRTHKFLTPQPLDRTPVSWQPGEDVRVQLADWVTNPRNENFGGAMVNRLWRHFLGVGLVEQVDDLRASNPPSNPELWRLLNREFVAHGYDLKHIMRLILNSRAYQLSSATRPGNEQDRKFHSHYYARRLPSEVMLDAISHATGVPDRFDGYPVGTRAIQLPEPGVGSYFLSLFGRSDRVTACACERNGDVTLPQLLHLQNAENILKKARSDEGRLKPLLADNDARVTEELFFATLGRQPSANELAAVTKSLKTGDPREEVFADLFWALLNTKEFAFNH